jgi:hypothetical protein
MPCHENQDVNRKMSLMTHSVNTFAFLTLSNKHKFSHTSTLTRVERVEFLKYRFIQMLQRQRQRQGQRQRQRQKQGQRQRQKQKQGLEEERVEPSLLNLPRPLMNLSALWRAF